MTYWTNDRGDSTMAGRLLCRGASMAMPRPLRPALFLLSCLAFAGTASAQKSPKVDKTLVDAAGNGSSVLDVIITTTSGSRGEIRDALQRHGDVVKGEHTSIDGVSA